MHKAASWMLPSWSIYENRREYQTTQGYTNIHIMLFWTVKKLNLYKPCNRKAIKEPK